MNAVTDLPRLRIVSPRARIAIVSPYGFDMECEYDYDEGEAPVFWPTELAHPGCPPNVELLACRVSGVDLMEMLSPSQCERIEDKILDQLEG